jgi:hypothetical protein
MENNIKKNKYLNTKLKKKNNTVIINIDKLFEKIKMNSK